MPSPTDDPVLGRTVEQFMRIVGFSRASYFKMLPEDRPRSMRLGTKTLRIIEQPAEWQARMAAQGGARVRGQK